MRLATILGVLMLCGALFLGCEATEEAAPAEEDTDGEVTEGKADS